MYVYIKSESQLYTVGFYDPSGKWIPESDHDHSEDAAKRVAWLNGNGEELQILESKIQTLADLLEKTVDHVTKLVASM